MARRKVDWRTASPKAFEEFKLAHPEIEISKQEWMEIIYQFNESFRNYLLETGERERLPYGFGTFAITKKKRKTKKILPDGTERINLAIDWKKTKEKGKYVYNLNLDTEGYFFGWKWFKEDARFKFVNLWWFKPSRISSRLIKHYLSVVENQQQLYKQWG